MSTVTSDPEKRKKKGLLGSLNDRLGLGEGTDAVAPRLRERMQGPLGIGPDVANIGLEQKKAEENSIDSTGNPSMNRTARMAGKTKKSIYSNPNSMSGSYTG